MSGCSAAPSTIARPSVRIQSAHMPSAHSIPEVRGCGAVTSAARLNTDRAVPERVAPDVDERIGVTPLTVAGAWERRL